MTERLPPPRPSRPPDTCRTELISSDAPRITHRSFLRCGLERSYCCRLPAAGRRSRVCAGAGYGLADGTEPTSFRQLANTMRKGPNWLARFRNLEPETAELLGVLVRTVRAVRVLELGASNGYSTMGLAYGVERFGGRIVSVDFDAETRIALARRNLERAGLEADLRAADAAEVLTLSASGTWDLVFLDSEWGAYVGYWPDLLRALRLGGSPSPGRRGRVLHVGARRRPGSNRVLRAFPNAGQREVAYGARRSARRLSAALVAVAAPRRRRGFLGNVEDRRFRPLWTVFSTKALRSESSTAPRVRTSFAIPLGGPVWVLFAGMRKAGRTRLRPRSSADPSRPGTPRGPRLRSTLGSRMAG